MNRPTGAVTPLFSERVAARTARFRSTSTEVQRATAAGGWETVAVCDDSGWASFIAMCLCYAADPASPLSDHDLAGDG
jgi:hypothetical protein